MLCRWLATTLSKAQMEQLSVLASDSSFDGRLRCRFAGWQDARNILPPSKQFSSIICADIVTMLLIGPGLLSAFFAQQRARLAVDGTLTMLLLTASDAMASARHATAYVGNEYLAGAQLPLREEVLHAATASGFAEPTFATLEDGSNELSGHVAATLRQWRLRLVARWRTARMLGASDASLRRRDAWLQPSVLHIDANLNAGHTYGC